MAKKGTKKKAKKAKTARATKTAQRKPARKTARKTARAARRRSAQPPARSQAASATRTIRFRCSGGCRATPPPPQHLGGPGSTVVLLAVNTDVTIDFLANGSPFRSGTDPIVISAGASRTEIVAREASGFFPYNLTCPTCPQVPTPTPIIPPEMIVP